MSDIKRTGGCSCNQFRYECGVDFIFAAFCHCRHCQQSSGSGSAAFFAVQRDSFLIAAGNTKSYAYIGDSGLKVRRHFCPDCGSPLYTEAEAAPDLFFVRAPSLDFPSPIKPQVKPQMHIYCDSSQAWDRPNDPLPKFGKMPD